VHVRLTVVEMDESTCKESEVYGVIKLLEVSLRELLESEPNIYTGEM
jgi:hypothetical protein